MRIRYAFLAGVAVLMASCASYYYEQGNFNKEFEQGDLQKALETLQKGDHLAHGKSKFLYYVNNGLLLSVMGKYEESNQYFENAFLFGEDHRANYFNEAASYLTNPNITVYSGEDHEHLLVLYFKALNYLKMGKREEALVECRRLNIRLQQLGDKYTSDNKYKRDAFIHMLMGIIYQADHDYNNAFIAYRNALEIYEDDYARMFHMKVPEQLKIDLLNTAWWTGFQDEFENYKTKFNMPDYKPEKPEAELVFFWHNGLCPVKDEWSVNFLINRQPDNWVVFSNLDLGLSFPFKVEEKDRRSSLSKLELFRVAFPKYVERPIFYERAELKIDSASYPLEVAEDVNQIAFYSLRERMMFEFSKGLLRAALKKVTEESIRKEDQALGAIIGLVNAITEKADTRNWQTLPYSINYARIPIREGKNKVEFDVHSIKGESATYDFNYEAKKGETLFHTFSSLESYGMTYRYN